MHFSLKPFLSTVRSNVFEPTFLKIGDHSFDGVDREEHLDRNYRSMEMEMRGEDEILFRYLTGQLLSNTDFTNVNLWLPFERRMSLEHDGYVHYNGDPSLRLVVWARGSREGYCYMHGALVVLDGNYILLAGSSGSGKTTLSGLVRDQGGTCLTEEDPFISCLDEVVEAHTTPWPGMSGPPAPFSGKLHSVFYLRHGERNDIRLLSSRESSQQLLEHSRTFNWLPDMLPAAMDLFNHVALTVPCYDFGFVPDQTAVEAMRRTL